MNAEYFISTKPNTNPNGNGSPAMLRVERGDSLTRLVVSIESGSAMNGNGAAIIISDVTIPTEVFDANKEVLLKDNIKL